MENDSKFNTNTVHYNVYYNENSHGSEPKVAVILPSWPIVVCNTSETFPIERVKGEFEKRGYGVVLKNSEDFQKEVDRLMGATNRDASYRII